MFSFFRGIQYFVDGMVLISRPGIKRYVVIPLVINILLFAIIFGVMQHYFYGLNDWLSQVLPTWLQWLSTVIWLFFLASFLLIVMVGFVVIANLIAAPFNSLLSERVAYLLTGKMPPSQGLFAMLVDVPRIVGRQLVILLYYLPRAIGLLILFFIPVVQIVMPVLWLYFNAWFMMLTYYDYPSDANRQSFSVMLASLRQQRALSIGFGGAVLFCSMVPVLNLVAIPAAVAGATKLWIESTSQRK